MDRRTRIIATVGPATDRPGALEGLCRAGLNVARFNCSHGTADEHRRRAANLRSVASACGQNVGLLVDLPGPKLRVEIAALRELIVDQKVTFAATPARDDIGVTDPECLLAVKAGHRILLDDGRLQLWVESASDGVVHTIVRVGGTLLPRKGVNLPDTPLSIPALTPRDLEALRLAGEIGADWLALSFVRSPEAADDLRRAAGEVGLHVPLLAKIERPEAVEMIDRIVAAFDGIMVARGDLGVETPLEQVPVLQKRLIHAARQQGKPVVTATDMLDSMRNSPRPTRAEASDVANAVYDGSDALMLSGETAVGQYPVEAIACMDRIARQAEADLFSKPRASFAPSPDLEEDLAEAVCSLAEMTEAAAIIVPTLSGKTARQMAKYRPRARIVAPVPKLEVRRRLSLIWGVSPVPLAEQLPAGADRIDAAVRAAFAAGEVQIGQRVVVVAGHPVEGGGRLPTLRLVCVGEGGTSAEPC